LSRWVLVIAQPKLGGAQFCRQGFGYKESQRAISNKKSPAEPTRLLRPDGAFRRRHNPRVIRLEEREMRITPHPLKVILLAVQPCRARDSWKLNTDMSGRLQELEIPKGTGIRDSSELQAAI